jgi:hypothetical protein
MSDEEQEIEIRINRQLFRVPRQALSGAELRRLPTPPLGADLDLFQIAGPGGSSDALVADSQVVDFDNGLEFFSTPSSILAGFERIQVGSAAP